MSEGDRRRAQILEILKKSEQPVSGTDLAGRLHVSRQVIVQDIALLRAGNKNILSTNKGYLLYDDHAPEKTYRRTERSCRLIKAMCFHQQRSRAAVSGCSG